MVTFSDIESNAEIMRLIEGSGSVLTAMNYTEHGIRHAKYVSKTAHKVLFKLGYDERICELAKIAGFTHDVGNSINRLNHGVTGATLLYPILKEMGMPLDDIHYVISAVGNHEEEIGTIINEVSAALVIADKSDAHRTRVRSRRIGKDDIHDRVNYAIKKNFLVVDGENKIISSKYYMDYSASVMDFLTIYLKRIVMSEKAAKYLDCTFRIYINDVLINSPVKYTAETIKKIKDEE